jgi:hypothetical protein
MTRVSIAKLKKLGITTPEGVSAGNKYGTNIQDKKTYSEMCGRGFDSIGERRYAEVLKLRERADDIQNLRFQVRIDLSDNPRKWVLIDYVYVEAGVTHYEDFKGKQTDTSSVKYAWLKDKLGIEVKLIRKEDLR